MKKLSAMLAVVVALAAAAPVAAFAKNGADDPPQNQVEDPANHG